MTSFVCSPLFNNKPLQGGKVSRKGMNHKISPCLIPRSVNDGICCKLRNRGGFTLPPQVPPHGEQRRRAIELLGCCTQRKRIRSTTAAELKRLVGAVPPNKLIAQQWKGAIQRDERKANLKVDPNAFRYRHMLLEKLKLPEKDTTVSRCFMLLDCLRRRYYANQQVTPSVINELTAALGSYPKSVREAHHYIRTLAYLNRERRAHEKNPPKMPLDRREDMQYASMLLGTFAVRGSAGKQTAKLEELLGAIPRNKNIASWWKTAVMTAIRKADRKQRAAKKREADDAKRLQRKLRKLEREQKAAAVLVHSKDGSSSDLTLGEEILPKSRQTKAFREVAVSANAKDPHQDSAGSYLLRLYKFIGRFFVSRP